MLEGVCEYLLPLYLLRRIKSPFYQILIKTCLDFLKLQSSKIIKCQFKNA